MPPGKKTAVLACMDARLDPARVLGLEEGDAHVIRNAGGVVTEDAIRSLLISQRLLGTEEIILIHHTDCGMVTFTDGAVKDQIEQDTGIRPSFALEAFPDADADVRESIARIKASPFIPDKDHIRGFVMKWNQASSTRSSEYGRNRRHAPACHHHRKCFRQAAAAAGVSERTLWLWLSNDQPEAVPARGYRLSSDDLDEYTTQRGNAAAVWRARYGAGCVLFPLGAGSWRSSANQSYCWGGRRNVHYAGGDD